MKLDIRRSNSNYIKNQINVSYQPKQSQVTVNPKLKTERRKLIENSYEARLNKNKSSVTQLPAIQNKSDFWYSNDIFYRQSRDNKASIKHSELVFIKDNFLKIMKIDSLQNRVSKIKGMILSI